MKVGKVLDQKRKAGAGDFYLQHFSSKYFCFYSLQLFVVVICSRAVLSRINPVWLSAGFR